MLEPFSVNLSVADIDVAVAWYCDVLGFEPARRGKYPERHLEIAFIRQGTFQIEIIQFDGSAAGSAFPDPPRHASVRGITHFALRVPNLDDAMAQLADRKVAVVSGPLILSEMKMKVVFVRDPDGNLVKLVEDLP
jgi:catechol 2,3-dioxygenase-like lactoylglutathione lyase family enzyme